MTSKVKVHFTPVDDLENKGFDIEFATPCELVHKAHEHAKSLKGAHLVYIPNENGVPKLHSLVNAKKQVMSFR